MGGQSETSMADGSDCSDSVSPSLTLDSILRVDPDKKHHVSNDTYFVASNNVLTSSIFTGCNVRFLRKGRVLVGDLACHAPRRPEKQRTRKFSVRIHTEERNTSIGAWMLYACKVIGNQ